MNTYPYVITISSEKGGVGKTTLATNLAIYLKGMNEDLPVTIFSFDNHFTVDKMFAIKGQPVSGDVAELLMETPASKLLTTGQYGVNYIASSTGLTDLKASIKNPMILPRLLALSNIPGILIIDTRPDLDILTENALYAADRVIIPVKDMPSLENCRNIFALFDKRGLDKKSLTLLPCLIDSRIKFDGPFNDQKTLLKAYAINRGYRCLDGYISKSPKVESLNTNPDGKIYPILTHARNTDVHQQFIQLGRQITEEYNATAEPRSLLFHQWLNTDEQRKKEVFEARLSGVSSHCILCGTSVAEGEKRPVSFYYESSDTVQRGFLEDNCFTALLVSSVYHLGASRSVDDPVTMLFRESAHKSVFVFRPFTNGGGTEIELNRFDLKGNLLSRKNHNLSGMLSTFMAETLGGHDDTLRNAFLLVHPTNPDGPEDILHGENYRSVTRLMKRAAEAFGLPA